MLNLLTARGQITAPVLQATAQVNAGALVPSVGVAAPRRKKVDVAVAQVADARSASVAGVPETAASALLESRVGRAQVELCLIDSLGSWVSDGGSGGHAGQSKSDKRLEEHLERMLTCTSGIRDRVLT